MAVNSDLKYSRGTQICAKFKGIYLPDDGGETLLTINRRSLLANRFSILDTLSPLPRADKKQTFLSTLQESHDMVIYNPKTKKLFKVTYSCSPEKTGEVGFDAFKKELKLEPTFYEKTHPIVNKELVPKEEFVKSVAEGFERLRLPKERDQYVSCVFFDVPPRKIDELSLEGIITEALRRTTVEPIGENVQRYAGQGYTYTAASNVVFAAHTYNGLDSIHVSIFGTADEILPVFRGIEKGINSRSGDITLRRDAWF
ncbi:TPA: hypothetical protein HA219_01350 [Candidatus Woesearchaeota archaeon]|nr:hypothetical protein [Candidatus Woesearchaeota archaeon]